MMNFATMLQQIGAKLSVLKTDVEAILNWFPYIIQEIWGVSQSQANPSDTSRIDTNAAGVSTLSTSLTSHVKYPESSSPDAYSHYAGGVKINGSYTGLGSYGDDLEDLSHWCDYHRKRKDPSEVPINGESALPTGHYQHWAGVVSLTDGSSLQTAITDLQQASSLENYSYKEYYLTADGGSNPPGNVYTSLDSLIAQINTDESNYWTTVYVGRGTFNATGLLTLAKNRVGFFGSGPESSTLGFQSLGLDNRSNIVFADLNFGGNTDITGDTVDRLLFKNCKISWSSDTPMNGGVDTFATLAAATRIIMEGCYTSTTDPTTYSVNIKIDGSYIYIRDCKAPTMMLLLGSYDASVTSLSADTRRNIYVEANHIKEVRLGQNGRAFYQVKINNNEIENVVTAHYASYNGIYPACQVEIIGNSIKNVTATTTGADDIRTRLRGTSIYFENNYVLDTNGGKTLIDLIPMSKLGSRKGVIPRMTECRIENNTFVLDEPTSFSRVLHIKELLTTDRDDNLKNKLGGLVGTASLWKILSTYVVGNKFYCTGDMDFITTPSADATYNFIEAYGTKFYCNDNQFYIYVNKATHATHYLYFNVINFQGNEFKINRNRMTIEGDTDSRDVTNNKVGVLNRGITVDGSRGEVCNNEIRVGGPTTVELPGTIVGAISLSTDLLADSTDKSPWVIAMHNITIDDEANEANWEAIDESWNGAPSNTTYRVLDNLPSTP